LAASIIEEETLEDPESSHMPPDMTSPMKMLTPDTSAYKQLQEFKVPLNGHVKEFLAFENGSELSET
jgi:hypothetical protein